MLRKLTQRKPPLPGPGDGISVEPLHQNLTEQNASALPRGRPVPGAPLSRSGTEAGSPLPAASGVNLESTRGLALIWIQIRLRPPAARDECVPLPGLYSRLLLAGVAPIKSRKLLPGIKWQEQGSQGQASGFIKKSFTSAFQLSRSEPEKYLFMYGNIWGKKEK